MKKSERIEDLSQCIKILSEISLKKLEPYEQKLVSTLLKLYKTELTEKRRLH